MCVFRVFFENPKNAQLHPLELGKSQKTQIYPYHLDLYPRTTCEA